MSSIKDKIRQEIERRRKLNEDMLEKDGRPSDLGMVREDEYLLTFIDSLPEEKPSEDLEEAAEERARKIYPYEGGTKGLICETSIPIFKAGFIAGAEWMKEQMMKEAVGAEISYWNQTGLSILPDKSLERLGYNESTRVKVIIVKEDDKG